MEKIVLVIGLLVVINTIYNMHTQNNKDLTQKFDDYIFRFNKQYSDIQKLYRMQVYIENFKQIESRNTQLKKQIYGETILSDLTDEEYISKYLTLRTNPLEFQENKGYYKTKNTTPIDWRLKGAVNEVRDLLSCNGGSWAFSTISSIEGLIQITTGELPKLSISQLLDCSTWADLNFGCDGGMPQSGMKQILRNGVTTEEEYPFVPYQQGCKQKGGIYHINGYTKLESSENAFTTTIQQQPISVGVDATNWKNYKPSISDLIFPSSECQDQINHTVLAIGQTENSYIIQNFWGKNWGAEGYIYLESGQNSCGIWEYQTIPY